MAKKQTTIRIPVALRDRLARHRAHPRESLADVVARALDAAEGKAGAQLGASARL
ncbi:MAG TPA: hypothetical protein VM681_10775 [Candidatus Thermoplasmatota archaeon]|nr:hypothetical protein [Candidatus Thermoplasmatota archaeon]